MADEDMKGEHMMEVNKSQFFDVLTSNNISESCSTEPVSSIKLHTQRPLEMGLYQQKSPVRYESAYYS